MRPQKDRVGKGLAKAWVNIQGDWKKEEATHADQTHAPRDGAGRASPEQQNPE